MSLEQSPNRQTHPCYNYFSEQTETISWSKDSGQRRRSDVEWDTSVSVLHI